MGDRATEESPFIRRLDSIALLTDDEREAIRRVPMAIRDLPPRLDLVREGDQPRECCLVLSGIAIRYKLAGDGQRQILAFCVPGDIPDLQSLHLASLDHNLASLTPIRAGFIPHEALHEIHARYPRIAGALWRETLIDSAIFREWMVGLGQRDALSRTAHLLCELFVRLQVVGLTDGREVTLPITQVEFADALGMTPVHINRTLQELRARKLITLKGKSLVVKHWEELRELGDFDPQYLQIAPNDRPAPP